MATDGMSTTATMNFDLDTHTDVRIAGTTESIAYSTQWSDPSGMSCTVAVDAPNGGGSKPLKAVHFSESGTMEWVSDPIAFGLYTLTHDDGNKPNLTAQSRVVGIKFMETDVTGTEGGTITLEVYGGAETIGMSVDYACFVGTAEDSDYTAKTGKLTWGVSDGTFSAVTVPSAERVIALSLFVADYLWRFLSN